MATVPAWSGGFSMAWCALMHALNLNRTLMMHLVLPLLFYASPLAACAMGLYRVHGRRFSRNSWYYTPIPLAFWSLLAFWRGNKRTPSFVLEPFALSAVMILLLFGHLWFDERKKTKGENLVYLTIAICIFSAAVVFFLGPSFEE